MNELIRATKHFLAFDVMYIVGGGCVIVSFLCLVGIDDPLGLILSTPVYLFLAGLAYVIGHATQESFCLLGLTATRHDKPSCLAKTFYKRYLGKKWKPPKEDFDYIEMLMIVPTEDNQRSLAEHDRIRSLQHVGTVIGPCAVVSGLLLASKAICRWDETYLRFAVPAILVGCLLIGLGGMKALQRWEFVSALKDQSDKSVE